MIKQHIILMSHLHKLQSSVTMILHNRCESSKIIAKLSWLRSNKKFNKLMKILRNIHHTWIITSRGVYRSYYSRSDNLLISPLTNSFANIIIGRIIIIINCWITFYTIYLVNRRHLAMTSAYKISNSPRAKSECITKYI